MAGCAATSVGGSAASAEQDLEDWEQELQSSQRLPPKDVPEMPVWLRMLHLPAAAWQHLSLNEPRGCIASVAGVSLIITAYGARVGTVPPTKAHPEAACPVKPSVPTPETQPPQASSAPISASPEQQPFASHPATFTFGTNTGPSNRRRKRLRAAGFAEEHQPGNSSSSSSPLDEPWPTEQHIILQSWGASACIRVVPPDWTDDRVPARGSQSQQAEDLGASQPSSSRFNSAHHRAPMRDWSLEDQARHNSVRANGVASPFTEAQPLRFSDSPRESAASGGAFVWCCWLMSMCGRLHFTATGLLQLLLYVSATHWCVCHGCCSFALLLGASCCLRLKFSSLVSFTCLQGLGPSPQHRQKQQIYQLPPTQASHCMFTFHCVRSCRHVTMPH